MVCAVFPAGNLAHAVAPGAPEVFVPIATGNYQQVWARIVDGRGIRLVGAVAPHFGQIVRASRGWWLHKRQESHVPGVAVRNSLNTRERVTSAANYICETCLPVTAGSEEPLQTVEAAIVSSTPALVPTQIKSLHESNEVTRRQAALCCRMMSSQLDSILFTEGARFTSKIISKLKSVEIHVSWKCVMSAFGQHTFRSGNTWGVLNFAPISRRNRSWSPCSWLVLNHWISGFGCRSAKKVAHYFQWLCRCPIPSKLLTVKTVIDFVIDWRFLPAVLWCSEFLCSPELRTRACRARSAI